jgi:glycosyltransferase involved in cell wall biosynthesis
MKVVQILPELSAGGVEGCVLELAAHLASGGHESIVISNGGRLVAGLETAGSRHLEMPVHRKALRTFLQVGKLRTVFKQERPDIVHVHSRVPATLAYLAWRGMDPATRPRLVTTVHGFYSVNAYSVIMTRGEQVIAVSESIRDYVLANYPKTDPAKLHVIHGGVDDTGAYPADFVPASEWLEKWSSAQPQLAGRIPLLMPARLTRWKGQADFIQLIAKLIGLGRPVHGLIVGEPHPSKLGYLDELKALGTTLGVSEHLSFLGHRSDLREIMAISALVYSLSTDPEAFGRVSLEALALGKPVVGYSHGGVAEQLNAIFPQGLVAVGNLNATLATTLHILDHRLKPAGIGPFTLRRTLEATTEIYQRLCDSPRS